jgi:hypothetical protein
MEITGVQAVGARSLGSVSITVSDTTLSAPRAPSAAVEYESGPSAPRSLHPEAVAFPRDGKPIDQRAVRLRQQHAHARYREDGGEAAN